MGCFAFNLGQYFTPSTSPLLTTTVKVMLVTNLLGWLDLDFSKKSRHDNYHIKIVPILEVIVLMEVLGIAFRRNWDRVFFPKKFWAKVCNNFVDFGNHLNWNRSWRYLWGPIPRCLKNEVVPSSELIGEVSQNLFSIGIDLSIGFRFVIKGQKLH